MTALLQKYLRIWVAIFAIWALLFQSVIPAAAADRPSDHAGFEICLTSDGSTAPLDHMALHGDLCCTLCSQVSLAAPLLTSAELTFVIRAPETLFPYFDNGLMPTGPPKGRPANPRAPPRLV